jgi:hypothetical protein
MSFLTEHPEEADRLRDALAADHEAQTEPSWPWASANANNVDRDLSQEDQPEDEFSYSSN